MNQPKTNAKAIESKPNGGKARKTIAVACGAKRRCSLGKRANNIALTIKINPAPIASDALFVTSAAPTRASPTNARSPASMLLTNLS